MQQREVVAGLPLLIVRNWYEAARFPDFAARHAEPGGITRKLDDDAAGRPLAFGIGIWAADRVRFDIDMRAGT